MSNVLVGCRGKFVNKRNVVKMVNVWEARTSAKFRKKKVKSVFNFAVYFLKAF